MAPDQPLAHTQASGTVLQGLPALPRDVMRAELLCSCQVAGGKRARDEGEPPRLSLATALPLSVWQDHLTPRLSRVEAARLRVCARR
jgi:hypothetical protein